MFFFFILSFFFIVSYSDIKLVLRPELKYEFEKFKQKYNKTYVSKTIELRHLKAYERNLIKAAELKKLNPYAEFGDNIFMDMDEEEFKKRLNLRHRLHDSMLAAEVTYSDAPSKWDWRPKGAVTPVKDQAACYSSFAYSTTAVIEGQWFLAGHPLTSLSEQAIVSCDLWDFGCAGGYLDSALAWLIAYNGGHVPPESAYPFYSRGKYVPECNKSKLKAPGGAVITGFKDLARNERAMAANLASQGPLSILVDASSWQSYSKGVITNCPGTWANHGALIVGYDKSNNPPYWIVKNSWGKHWGEEGYIRIKLGSNLCLISSSPVIAIVSKN